MNASEELMLLLELNGYDVTKFKLKKQLEYEQEGTTTLYKSKSLQDLILRHYTYHNDEDYLHRNPLMYQDDWDDDITSIDQFYVTHPDLEPDVTLRDVIQTSEFDEVHKESILYDILDGWVEEYRESSIVRMENLRELIKRMPKKSKKYKKPSLVAFLFALLLGLYGMFLFRSPETLELPLFPFFGYFAANYVPYLYDVPWYGLLGNFAIYMIIIYAVTNAFFRRYMKDIRSEKNKRAERTFDKWDQDMKNVRLKQAGILEDYVDRVIKNPSDISLDITSLMAPEQWMDKLKAYVMMIERKYDRMTKYYKTYRSVLRLGFVIALVSYASFFAVGFAMMRGWIGV